MKSSAIWVSIGVAVVAGFAIWYFGFREKPLSVTTVVEEEPLITPANPYVSDTPETTTPIDTTPEEPVEQTPELSESDPWVREKFDEIDPWLDEILGYDDLIRKITVAGDQILRDQNPYKQLFFLKPEKGLSAVRRDGKLYLADKSYERYDRAISIFESLDSATLARNFKMAMPLFRTAWGELGNGSKWEEQIDPLLERILAVRPVEGDIELYKSGGIYMFADEKLEALPPLDKAFIRMGPKNLNRIQQKLISIRESM